MATPIFKRPQILAHRGGRRWAPENTLEAFRLSLDLGVDGIEFDVHRCATGELVVIHDDDLDRTTNGVGLVKDVSFAELQRLDAGSWFNPHFAGAKIPLLAEVLDLVNGKVVLNIELKNTPIDYFGIENDVLELLSTYPRRDKIIISSFDHKLMKKIAQKDPSVNLALLADALFVNLPEYASQMQAKYWHPCFGSLRQDAMDEARQAGLLVNPWTLNSTKEWAQAIRLGVDGIVTDDPEGLLSYIGKAQAIFEQIGRLGAAAAGDSGVLVNAQS